MAQKDRQGLPGILSGKPPTSQMAKPNCLSWGLGLSGGRNPPPPMESGLESFAHVVHDRMDRAGEQATQGCGERGEQRKAS